MKNILVTGGAGYIGSHTIIELIKKGYNPIVFDNFSNSTDKSLKLINEYFKKELTVINGDIINMEDLDEVFKQYGFDGIVHFAGCLEVGESMINPIKYYKNIVSGSINLVELANKYNVKNIVFSSTAGVYGIPNVSVISEDTIINPINTYGKAKYMVERILEDASRAYGIRSIRLRYFNVAGASEIIKIGEAHRSESHLIPNILLNILGIKNGFKLFGNDYNTKDGTCVRDYIYVCDLALAHVKAIEVLESNEKNDFSIPINLGTKSGYSNLEIIKTCEDVTGKTLNYETVDRRPGDPDKLVADNTKAMEVLNWRPTASLKQIIQSAWNWHSSIEYIEALGVK